MNRLIAILILMLTGLAVFSQKPIMVKGSVFDSESGEPINAVHIAIKGEATGSITDLRGNYSIELNKAGDTLVYTHLAYDSVHVVYYGTNLHANIIFEPLEYMLPDAIVKPVVNISHGMLLDVIDYTFIGDTILYAGFCYRYNKRNNPWVVMIGPKGDTIFTECVHEEGTFYRDCFENIHYLTEDNAYQLNFEGDSLKMEFPTDIDEFESVMYDCKFQSNGKILFSQFTDRDQILLYYFADLESYETEIFRTIADEVKLNMLAFQGLFFSMGKPPNEHDLRFEEMMYDPVYAPIFRAKDTIAIVNYTDSKIELYDTCFNSVGETDIYFQNSKHCEENIVVDKETGRVYVVFLRDSQTSVKEVFLNSGSTGQEISIPSFPWIDNIQVRDNQLFFLYREKFTGDLRALYRMFLD